MRVAYIHTDPLPSDMAGSVFALNTAVGMAQAGLDTTLIMPSAGVALPDALKRYGIEALPDGLSIELTAPISSTLGPFSLGRQARFAGRVREVIDEKSIGAVVVRTLTLADRLLKMQPRIPMIYEAHNWYAEPERKWSGTEGLVKPGKLKREIRLGRIEKRVISDVNALVLLQHAMVQPFTEHFPGIKRIEVLPSGMLPPVSLPEPADDPVAVYVGQLHPHKGVGVLLQAVALARDLRLLVIGGPALLEHWKQEARRLEIADRVLFTGHVPHAEVARRMSGARIGVAPLRDCFYNRHLTSPMKIMEYFAAGLPVVGSDVPTVREMVGEERGLLVPADDPPKLAAAMRELITDGELHKRCREQIKTIFEDHSWKARGLGYARLLSDLADVQV